jgi:hypothetical protein
LGPPVAGVFGPGGGFFGYWAIEAAGVVKAFHIDGSSFRDAIQKT